MSPTIWDKEKERLLLLQIIALNEIKVTSTQWDQIAQMWNNGIKGDAFRKRFAKMKEESVKRMEDSGMVVAGGRERMARPTRPLAQKGQKRAGQGMAKGEEDRGKKLKVMDLDDEINGASSEDDTEVKGE